MQQLKDDERGHIAADGTDDEQRAAGRVHHDQTADGLRRRSVGGPALLLKSCPKLLDCAARHHLTPMLLKDNVTGRAEHKEGVQHANCRCRYPTRVAAESRRFVCFV